jgi:hypothetical protein
VEEGKGGVGGDGGAGDLEENANDDGADDFADAEADVVQGEGLDEVFTADDVEGEGAAAGVFEGAGAASKDGTDEEVPGLYDVRGEEGEDGGGDDDVEGEGREDDFSAVDAVARRRRRRG